MGSLTNSHGPVVNKYNCPIFKSQCLRLRDTEADDSFSFAPGRADRCIRPLRGEEREKPGQEKPPNDEDDRYFDEREAGMLFLVQKYPTMSPRAITSSLASSRVDVLEEETWMRIAIGLQRRGQRSLSAIPTSPRPSWSWPPARMGGNRAKPAGAISQPFGGCVGDAQLPEVLVGLARGAESVLATAA